MESTMTETTSLNELKRALGGATVIPAAAVSNHVKYLFENVSEDLTDNVLVDVEDGVIDATWTTQSRQVILRVRADQVILHQYEHPVGEKAFIPNASIADLTAALRWLHQ
jgi:hypothetical protein